MKYFTLITFLFFTCANSKTAYVLSVDPEISTFYKINQDVFMNFFKEEIKKKKISCEEFNKIISELKSTSESEEIDVRGMIIFQNDTLISDKFFTKFKGKTYITDKNLSDILWVDN